MEHTISLIWLAFWPILIFAIYRISYAVLKHKKYLYEEGDEN